MPLTLRCPEPDLHSPGLRAGNGGGGIGAALYAYQMVLGKHRQFIMEHAYSWFTHFLRGFKNCGRVSGAKEVPHGRDPEHCQ
jgi:hypothetical protein